MWMMENNNGAGYIQPSASDFSSGAVTSGLPLTSEPVGSAIGQTTGNNLMNDYFKYQLLTGQTGGDSSRGLFGGNLFSGSDSDSTCPARDTNQYIAEQYIDISNININIGFSSSSNININTEKLVAIYCQYIDRAIYCQFRAIYCRNRAIYCSLYGR